MERFILFFAGCFLANGIPHYTQGVSGKDFCTPFFYRFMKFIPAPLFNSIWGLLNFCLTGFLFSICKEFKPGMNSDTLAVAAGFAFASVCLSLFFRKGGWQRD